MCQSKLMTSHSPAAARRVRSDLCHGVWMSVYARVWPTCYFAANVLCQNSAFGLSHCQNTSYCSSRISFLSRKASEAAFSSLWTMKYFTKSQPNDIKAEWGMCYCRFLSTANSLFGHLRFAMNRKSASSYRRWTTLTDIWLMTEWQYH